MLLVTMAFASAQTRAFPLDRYWSDYGYDAQGTANSGFGVTPHGYHGPDYYDSASGRRYRNSRNGSNGWRENRGQ
jgi:hypothetical protein